MEDKVVNSHSKIVSWAVFAFALTVILPNLMSVVFPSLIHETILKTELGHTPFELGSWAIPVLISNFSILGLGILFYTNKIPGKIRRLFQFVIKFEISRDVALFVAIIIIFVYVGASLPELAKNEGLIWGDFSRVKPTVDAWPEIYPGAEDLWILHVKNFFVKSSVILFDNYRIIPFLATVSILLVTYLLTLKITGKRLSGIIAMAVLTQSNIFLVFDSIATYANFWVLFYLVSIYLIIKKWSLSPVSYLASIFCKPLTAAFFPLTLFFIFRSEIRRRKKIYLLLSYVVLAILIGLFLLFSKDQSNISGGIISGVSNISYVDFLSGFTVWAFQLRFEGWFLLLILPLTVGLFLTARNGNPYADAILFMIAGIIISMPLMTGLTTYNLHPYRFTPLIVFFAIGIGILFSQRNYSSTGMKTE